MAKTQLKAADDARKQFAACLAAASAEDPVHTVVTRHGAPRGVIVGFEWYRRAREALGDPTDLVFSEDQ